MSITIDARDANGGPDGSVYLVTVPFQPFATTAPGTLLSAAQIRTLISVAWNAQVTALGLTAGFGDIVYQDCGNGQFQPKLKIHSNAAIYVLIWNVHIEGYPSKEFAQNFSGGMGSTAWDFQAQLSDVPVKSIGAVMPKGLTINVTDGDPSDAPANGIVIVTAGSLSCIYTYGSRDISQGILYLADLMPMAKQTPFTADQLATGATAQIMYLDKGDWATLALHALCSSGTGLRSFSYDTLPTGQGYGIPESLINTDSFVKHLGTGVLGTFQGQVPSAGQSFTGSFGGLLALLRLAVVCRPDTTQAHNPLVLTLVDTGSGTDYTTTVTDADLLCNEGDPVVSIKRADAANSIIVQWTSPSDSQTQISYIFNDQPSIEAEGKRQQTYSVLATDPQHLQQIALPATASHFAYDQTIQAIQLRVHPSVAAEVGDAVWLTITHPAVWSWATNPGQCGYNGAGRVMGRELNPASSAVTLTLLIDGAVRMNALSPAALVLNYSGTTNPTWVDVDHKYLSHFKTAFAKAQAASETLHAIHYQPGQAEAASGLTITGVSDNGNCHLLTTYTGTMAVGLRSTLTLPATASTTAYQKNFAHALDGTNWN